MISGYFLFVLLLNLTFYNSKNNSVIHLRAFSYVTTEVTSCELKMNLNFILDSVFNFSEWFFKNCLQITKLFCALPRDLF